MENPGVVCLQVTLDQHEMFTTEEREELLCSVRTQGQVCVCVCLSVGVCVSSVATWGIEVQSLHSNTVRFSILSKYTITTALNRSSLCTVGYITECNLSVIEYTVSYL